MVIGIIFCLTIIVFFSASLSKINNINDKITINKILKFKSLYDEIIDKEYLVELLIRKILIVGTFLNKNVLNLKMNIE